MNPFPTVDPIPLPAPVWLFKLLHILTLGLHFITVETLLGGLLAATALSLLARSRDGQIAAAAMARRLPVLMTYVINLGVPPLLFAQVLYGRALYTSSVLIGLSWIAVIPLLMACYWLLYRFSAGLDQGRRVWWMGLLAFILAGGIARIYSSNMTLMLRPEVWSDMYARSAVGAFLPQGDATLVARWFFMMTGGLLFGGLWMIYLSGRRTIPAESARLLALLGGAIASTMAIFQPFAAWAVLNAQPAAVRAALTADTLYRASGIAWLSLMGVALLLGVVTYARRAPSGLLSWTAVAVAATSALSLALYRDGLRDLTLLSKGFDVWQRTVVTNWGVVILFLVLFVLGLAAAGWLISVVARAKKPMEGVA